VLNLAFIDEELVHKIPIGKNISAVCKGNRIAKDIGSKFGADLLKKKQDDE